MLTYTATHQTLITDSGQKTRGAQTDSRGVEGGREGELEEQERPLRKREKRLKKRVYFFSLRRGSGGCWGWTSWKEPCQKFRCEARLCCNLSKTAGTSLKWRQVRATAKPAGGSTQILHLLHDGGRPAALSAPNVRRGTYAT